MSRLVSLRHPTEGHLQVHALGFGWLGVEIHKPQHCPDTIMPSFTHALPDVWYRHEVNDELMRFFEHCRSFVESVENNKTALVEVKKFKEGPEMGDIRRKMARQLNVPYERATAGWA